MGFNAEKEKEHFITLWKNRKPSGLKHGSADWDRRSDRWAKELNADPVRSERSRKRIEATAAYLRSQGLLGENDSVIDIGCGPGRFVCEFAKTAAHVTGTDISPKMCAYGQEYADLLGLDNVGFTVCDFAEADIDELGWRNSFDLVFSSITPALSTYEALKKSEQMSRGWCFQSNFIKTTDSLGDKVLREVLPNEMLPIERSLRSFYVLCNILLLEGKMPRTSYYKEEEDVRTKVDDDLILKEIRMAPNVPRTEEYFGRLKDAFMKYADEDGMVSIHREWHHGWLLWHV